MKARRSFLEPCHPITPSLVVVVSFVSLIKMHDEEQLRGGPFGSASEFQCGMVERLWQGLSSTVSGRDCSSRQTCNREARTQACP